MSTTYTANIVVGLHAEDLEDWAQENEENLEDLFDYYPIADVYGYCFLSTEVSTTLNNSATESMVRLINKFIKVVGISPKVMLVVDSY